MCLLINWVGNNLQTIGPLSNPQPNMNKRNKNLGNNLYKKISYNLPSFLLKYSTKLNGWGN